MEYKNCSVYYSFDVDSKVINIYPNDIKYSNLEIGQVMQDVPKAIKATVQIEDTRDGIVNRMSIVGESPMCEWVYSADLLVPLSSFSRPDLIPEKMKRKTFFRKREVLRYDVSFNILQTLMPYEKIFFNCPIVVHKLW